MYIHWKVGRYFIRKKVRSIFLRSGLQLFPVNQKKKKKGCAHQRKRERETDTNNDPCGKICRASKSFWEKKKKSLKQLVYSEITIAIQNTPIFWPVCFKGFTIPIWWPREREILRGERIRREIIKKVALLQCTATSRSAL